MARQRSASGDHCLRDRVEEMDSIKVDEAARPVLFARVSTVSMNDRVSCF